MSEGVGVHLPCPLYSVTSATSQLLGITPSPHTLLPDPARCVPRAPRAFVFARDFRDCPPGRSPPCGWCALTLHPLQRTRSRITLQDAETRRQVDGNVQVLLVRKDDRKAYLYLGFSFTDRHVKVVSPYERSIRQQPAVLDSTRLVY